MKKTRKSHCFYFVLKTLWYRSTILVKNIMIILVICTALSFTVLYVLKKYNYFVQFLLSQRLPRTIIHFNTILFSGILFLHLETGRSYFQSKLYVIIGLYYQRPILITIIAFSLLGKYWFSSLALKLGFWSALRFLDGVS